jgi:hypothetical protein
MARPEGLKAVEITQEAPKEFVVRARWEGVDRPVTSGIVATSMAVALRLKQAHEDGATLENKGIETDVSGQTYVNESWKVLARRLNADLRRLGY